MRMEKQGASGSATVQALGVRALFRAVLARCGKKHGGQN